MVSPQKSKDKSISPLSHHDSHSSMNSKQKNSKDLKKIGLIQKVTTSNNPAKQNYNENTIKIPQINVVRAPLEIINEYHREHSAEAITDNKATKSNDSFNHDEGNNLNIVDNFELPNQEIPNPDTESNYPHIFEKPSSKNSPLEGKNKNASMPNTGLAIPRRSSRDREDPSNLNSNSSCFLKKNGNSNLIGSEEFEGLNKMISNRIEKSEKKKAKEKPLPERIKEIHIFSIFPEKRLANSGDGIIVLIQRMSFIRANSLNSANQKFISPVLTHLNIVCFLKATSDTLNQKKHSFDYANLY
jgi:hypothetical protein